MKTPAALLALASLAAAVPLAELERRELVLRTTIIPVVETVVVTTTIGGGESSPSPLAAQKAVQQVQKAPAAQPDPAPSPSPSPAHAANPSPAPAAAAAAVAAAPQQQQQQPQQQQQQQAAPAKQATSDSQDSSSSASADGSSYVPITHPQATVPDGPSSKDHPFKGSATFYYPQDQKGAHNGDLTSCGGVHYDDDMIFAVSHLMMGVDAKWPNSLCGRAAMIVGPSGKSQRAVVADMCPGCSNPDSTKPYNIDLTLGLFQAIGGVESEGRVDGISWYWI